MSAYLFAASNLWNVHVPITLALAAVATIGYLVGRWRRDAAVKIINHSQRDLRHAQQVAAELEKIAWGLRKNLSKHQASVDRFKDRLNRLGEHREETAWKQLCSEAEEILKPTLHLATQISEAYDRIRHQSSSLMSITEVRTDPLTNVKNRRGLDDALRTQFALMSRYGATFSLVIFDVDYFKCINDEQGHLQGDHVLQALARLLDEHVRETDVVVRYGGDEFLVVMPQTDLDGAFILSERLRLLVQDKMSVTVSGGVSSATSADNEDALLARADAALYQAKSSGRNCICQHDGQQIITYAQKEAESMT
jgi:diguanylate cyclase